MSNDIYKKQPASVLPTKTDVYLTESGGVSFNAEEKCWQKYREPRLWWMMPIEQPIPSPKGLTLEDAKQWLYTNDDFKYQDINGVDVPTMDSIAEVIFNYATECVLSNTAKMAEEIDELKESCATYQGHIFEFENNPNFKSEAHKQLEQQLQTAKDSLELALKQAREDGVVDLEQIKTAIQQINK